MWFSMKSSEKSYSEQITEKVALNLSTPWLELYVVCLIEHTPVSSTVWVDYFM